MISVQDFLDAHLEDHVGVCAYPRVVSKYRTLAFTAVLWSDPNLSRGTDGLQTRRWREPNLKPQSHLARPAAHQSGSLQAREVEREHQREKRLEQTEEGVVVDMPRAGLRHRPQSAGIAEGDTLGTGPDFITALRPAGNWVEPIERAPVPIAARDP